jgi:hypothetical protein
MTTLNEGTYISDVIRWTACRLFSYACLTVIAPAALTVGSILAKRTKSVVVAAKLSGTGNGTISACTLGATAKPGVYFLIAASTGATALFRVYEPAGAMVGALTVGTPFTSTHINLTVSDGSADWTEGDIITVTVSGDNAYVEAVYGAVDGTGEPCAVLADNVAITTGLRANVLVRDGVIATTYVSWPASYDSAPKKAAATASLETLSRIIVASAEV